MQELDKLAWFGSSKGVASLVADAMKEDGAHSLSDVAVALQAAHLLVWQHEVEHGEAWCLLCSWLDVVAEKARSLQSECTIITSQLHCHTPDQMIYRAFESQ